MNLTKGEEQLGYYSKWKSKYEKNYTVKSQTLGK